MPDISEFHHYTVLLEKLIQIADKEDLAECAKLLAMNVAHYEMRYGALPLEEQLAITSKLNEHHAELLIDGNVVRDITRLGSFCTIHCHIGPVYQIFTR